MAAGGGPAKAAYMSGPCFRIRGIWGIWGGGSRCRALLDTTRGRGITVPGMTRIWSRVAAAVCVPGDRTSQIRANAA